MLPESQYSAINGDQQSDSYLIEIRKTNELRNLFVSYGIDESRSEIHHRMKVLASLYRLVKQWIREKPLGEDALLTVADTIKGNIYIFGSNEFKAHHTVADIDALCLTPRHVDRTDYFTSFFELLKSQPQIKDFKTVDETFVPVLEMEFDGIKITLLFAKEALKEMPDLLDLSDVTLSRRLDNLVQSVRFLNERQVMGEICRLVPNIENFKLTFQTIKLWANRHGIYSNKQGLLDGVSWAILVARTCQLYPNAAPATLVHKFFLVFSQWKWPQPVLLKRPDELGFPFWNPRMEDLSDHFHLMPIITPTHPQQNSALNVCASTRTAIMERFTLGLAVTDEIMLGKCTWERLFKAPNSKVLVTERTLPVKRKLCEMTAPPSAPIKKMRQRSQKSTGEVSMNEDTSNKCEVNVNMQSRTSKCAPATSGSRVSGETLQQAGHHSMRTRSSTNNSVKCKKCICCS